MPNQIEKTRGFIYILEVNEINNGKNVIDDLQKGIEKMQPIYNWVCTICNKGEIT